MCIFFVELFEFKQHSTNSDQTRCYKMNFILIVVIALSKLVDTKNTSINCLIGRNIESFNSTLLPDQTLISMEKGERKQYHFQINAPTTIKITFSSCTNLITSKLYYNQSIQIAKASSGLTIQCAPIGRYDMVLQARHPCVFEVKTFLHHTNENWPLANYWPLSLIEPSKIKYQIRIKKKEMVVRWNKSKLDIHAVHYCLAINTVRNQQSLCEAITHSAKPNELSKQLCFMSSLDHLYHKKFGNVMKLDPDPELVTVSCGGRKNRLIVKGLVPNKKYFVDLFGVHTKMENVTFLLNSTFVQFNRTRPVLLKNNSLTTFQLPQSGRPAVFVYKVPTDDACRQLKLFTIPCGRNVRLKIISKLFQNTTAMEFHKSSTMLLNSKPSDKLVFKFSTNVDGRSSKKVRVLLSCSDSFTQMPQLPQNTSLEQNFDETDCTTTAVSWNSSPDSRSDIWYCIYIIEINQRGHLFDDFFLSNICIGTSPNKHPHLYQMQCLQNPLTTEPTDIQNNLRIHHLLTELSPNRYYAVYVMLRLNDITLPYDKLLISTKSKCTFELKAYKGHRDDHALQNQLVSLLEHLNLNNFLQSFRSMDKKNPQNKF